MSLCISSRDGRASSCTRQQSEVGCGKVHRGGRCQWASPFEPASSRLEKAAALEQKGREGGVGDEDVDEDMDEDVDEDVDEDGEGGDGDGDGHKDD